MKSSTKGKAQRKAAAASPEPKRSAHATHSGRHVDLGCPGGGARVATFITAIETCSCSWMLCMADTTWGAQGSGVLATKAVERRGKRRCLGHAGGGNTRQKAVSQPRRRWKHEATAASYRDVDPGQSHGLHRLCNRMLVQRELVPCAIQRPKCGTRQLPGIKKTMRC